MSPLLFHKTLTDNEVVTICLFILKFQFNQHYYNICYLLYYANNYDDVHLIFLVLANNIKWNINQNIILFIVSLTKLFHTHVYGSRHDIAWMDITAQQHSVRFKNVL